jgi:hypothetical protein
VTAPAFGDAAAAATFTDPKDRGKAFGIFGAIIARAPRSGCSRAVSSRSA